MLLLTGLIWGVAFVAQSEGMNYVGAFTFNCCRFMIGGVMLIPCIFFLRSIGAGEKAIGREWRENPFQSRANLEEDNPRI